MIKKVVCMAMVGIILLAGGAENRIYKGHYASGIAKYTVKNGHVYEGHYASGISKWTFAESSGLLHVYSGHYASGISKFTYKNGHLYSGHYASGISQWTAAISSGLFHVYSGHYASGISKYTVKNGHVYAGHYASGISKWTFGATDEVPEGVMVFLVTQVLAEEATPSPPSGGSGAGGGEIPAWKKEQWVTPVPPTTRSSNPQPEPVVDLSGWNKARTLRGIVEVEKEVLALTEVKCGKRDRRGTARVSASLILLSGKKRTYRSQKVSLGQSAVVSVSWDGLRVEIDGDLLNGTSSLWMDGVVRSATIGGGLPEGRHRFSTVGSGPLGIVSGYEVLQDLLPTERSFDVVRNRWSFDRKDAAAVRLTYNAKTGVFKGTFKVHLSNACCTTRRVRVKKSTAKVYGFIVDGVGCGTASVKMPTMAFNVVVD